MTNSSSEYFQDFTPSENQTPEQVLNVKNIRDLSCNHALKKLSAIKICFETLLLKQKNTMKFKKITTLLHLKKIENFQIFFSKKYLNIRRAFDSKGINSNDII